MQKTTIVKNAASLTLMQVANALVPLFVIPFVVRALGVEAFGKVSYAQTIVAYFSLLVNYGFEYSATQEIALNREQSCRLRVIFWSVLKSKLFLLLVAFLAYVGLIFLSPRFEGDTMLYLFAFLINVGMAITPTWFFQGMESMWWVALINVVMKVLAALFILLLVVGSSDYNLYVLLMSLSYCGAGLALFFLAYFKYELKYESQFDFSPVRKGFPIFLNTALSNIYALGGITIIGIYLSNAEIGIYAGAHKIVSAMSMMLSMPLSMALFPALSREFSQSVQLGWKSLKKCIGLVFVVGSVFTVVLYGMSPIIVKIFLGDAFSDVIPLLQMLSPIPMLVVMATMFTVQGLYGMQAQNAAPLVGGVVALFSLVAYWLAIPMYGVYAAAVVYIISELLEIMIVYLILFRRIHP